MHGAYLSACRRWNGRCTHSGSIPYRHQSPVVLVMSPSGAGNLGVKLVYTPGCTLVYPPGYACAWRKHEGARAWCTHEGTHAGTDIPVALLPLRTFHTHESRRRSQRGFLELDLPPSPVRTHHSPCEGRERTGMQHKCVQDKWEQDAWQDKAQFCKTKRCQANVSRANV